jgi:hypothetical protein
MITIFKKRVNKKSGAIQGDSSVREIPDIHQMWLLHGKKVIKPVKCQNHRFFPQGSEKKY